MRILLYICIEHLISITMTTQEKITYHDKQIVNRESEVTKTIISIRISSLTDDEKIHILSNLRYKIDQEINDIVKKK